MNLTEARRLLDEKDRCRDGRIDIRYATQRALAHQVPELVAEVERLEGQVQDAATTEREAIIQDLEATLERLMHQDIRRPVAAIIERIRKREFIER